MVPIAPLSLSSVPVPNRATLWLGALIAPAALAPVWCLTIGRLPSDVGTVSSLVLLLLLTACSITDVSRRKIYNWATYSAVTWAGAINAAASFTGSPQVLGAIGWQPSLYGCCGCFAVMLFAYALARGGAGDVKMGAAIGALVGLEQGILALAFGYILAGASILAWSIWTRGPYQLLAALGRLIGSMLLPLWIERPTQTDKVLLNTPVPLAGFFSLGTLIVIFEIL